MISRYSPHFSSLSPSPAKALTTDPVIQAACVTKLKEETEDHPGFQDFDGGNSNSTPADGRSTAGVSGAGTPMASAYGNGAGAPKLKLTFNGNRSGFANGGDSGMNSEED